MKEYVFHIPPYGSGASIPPIFYHGPYIPTSPHPHEPEGDPPPSNRIHLVAFEVWTAFAAFMDYRLFRRPPLSS